MPTRYRVHAYRPPPSWVSIWEYMFAKLVPNAAQILTPTGFYQRYDISVPDMAERRKLSIEEEDAIGRIATALAVAADAAHQTPPGIVKAWLERIGREPALFRSERLPAEVHWKIASSYRRGSEWPGTHLQDVWGRRRVRFKSKARRATDTRIAKAASLALVSLKRPLGRPRKVANGLLAEYLATAFRWCGGRIARQVVPLDKDAGGVRYVADGAFHQFVGRVIGPLQEHLNSHGLTAVTIETIERIATEQFALAG